MLRTLIIDDSRTFRTSLSDALTQHATVEVVATEFSVERGLKRQCRGDIDLVLLDIQMPGGNGLDYLSAWRKHPIPRPMVIAMSGVFGSDATEVDKALALGAAAFLQKPDGGIESFLLDLDRELARLGVRSSTGPNRRSRARGSGALGRVGELVAIVSSTGGPEALQVFLRGLTEDFRPPVVIVQHLPPKFARTLAPNLTRRCGREVRPAREGQVLQRGDVVIAPGPSHLEIHREGQSLVCRGASGPKEVGCKPSGNRMLRTAAIATGGRMTGITLTGMGSDGADGMSEVARRGGQVIVQDEETSVVWGMPAAVLQTGVKALVLPLERIAATLNRKQGKAA